MNGPFISSLCRCSYGEVTCKSTTCPLVSCSHPTQGKCCQTCDDGCEMDGWVYHQNERFNHPHDICQDCTCDRGSVRCVAQTCRASCSHPRSVAGQCCPVCDQGCRVDQDYYEEGEVFEKDCQVSRPGLPRIVI